MMISNTFLIKNGTIVNSSNSQCADILVQNGKIEKIEQDLIIDLPSNQMVDANGLYILPGGIDPHVHMQLPTPAGPSSDDFYSGSQAALAGGTTTIIDFVTPNRGQSLVDALKLRNQEAQKCCCNYSFHVSPVEWRETTAREMETCVKEWGITSFKTYLAYKNSVGITYEVLEKVMETANKLGVMVTIHAEDGDIIEKNRIEFIRNRQVNPRYHALSRPPETEYQAVEQVIKLVEKIQCPLYFVHLSTSRSVDLVRKAKQSGLPVFAETCPQYLVLDESVYQSDFYQSGKYVISPPIRAKLHQQALWEGLTDGTIDTIGTDHCPFNLYGQKDIGLNDFTKIPNGAGGIEFRLSLLYTYGVLSGKITIEQMVKLFSTESANLFKIKNKGQIKPGFDADLVLWNPSGESIITKEKQWQRCDSNIYDRFAIKGKVLSSMIAGNPVYKNGIFSTGL